MNTTIANNKLIAFFMGFKMLVENYHGIYFIESPTKKTYDLQGLKYDSDWNWLMLVVENINLLSKFDKNFFGVSTQYYNRCLIHCYKNEQRVHTIDILNSETNIQATYLAVIEFINWYNSCKSK